MEFNNVLLRLKGILNSIPDCQLEEMSLFIDCQSGVELIAVEDNAITLITETDRLKIDDMTW